MSVAPIWLCTALPAETERDTPGGGRFAANHPPPQCMHLGAGESTLLASSTCSVFTVLERLERLQAPPPPPSLQRAAPGLPAVGESSGSIINSQEHK